MTQLAKELPFAEVLNIGTGGARLDQLQENFDVQIAPLRPDYVIVNTATNDAYTLVRPSSSRTRSTSTQGKSSI